MALEKQLEQSVEASTEKIPEVPSLLTQGLESLKSSTHLRLEDSEGFEDSFQCQYHFDVIDQNESRLFHIAESSEKIFNLFNALPSQFQFSILDPEGHPLMLVSGFDPFWGYPNDFTIEHVGGHFGHVVQKRAYIWSSPKFYVCDKDQNLVFRILGSQMEWFCCSVVPDYNILRRSGAAKIQCGTINKLKENKEISYNIIFDEELEIYEKTLLMIMTIILHLRVSKSKKRNPASKYYEVPASPSTIHFGLAGFSEEQ